MHKTSKQKDPLVAADIPIVAAFHFIHRSITIQC